MTPRNAASAREGALSGQVTVGGHGDTLTIRRNTNDLPLVLATSYVVFGRIRPRAIFLVECPRCGRMHAHTGRVPFQTGTRTAACGARYAVQVGAREQDRVVA